MRVIKQNTSRKDRTLYYKDKKTGKKTPVPEKLAADLHPTLSKKKEFIGDEKGDKTAPYADLSSKEREYRVHNSMYNSSGNKSKSRNMGNYEMKKVGDHYRAVKNDGPKSISIKKDYKDNK